MPRAEQWAVDEVYACLRETSTRLDELGTPYVMVAGTLLGALRHAGMIPWDHDADLGIRASDASTVWSGLIAKLANSRYGLAHIKGFGIIRVFPLNGLRLRPWHRFRFPWVDIFAMQQRSDGRWCYAGPRARRSYENEVFPPFSFGHLRRYPFGPLHLSAPEREVSHQYLESAYGADWRTQAQFFGYYVQKKDHQPRPLNDFLPAWPSWAPIPPDTVSSHEKTE